MLCFEQFEGPAEYFCCSLKCEQIEPMFKNENATSKGR
jgi:hypothetical protein